MSYATLMVYVDALATPEPVVRVAAGLADKFTSTLIGVSALAVRPPFVTEGMVIEQVTETAVADLKSRLAGSEAWFRATVEDGRRTVAWRSAVDFPTDALAREARSGDLLVIEQKPRSRDFYTALDPGEAILIAGRPILVVPEPIGTLRAERVIVGWKEAREARRALQDALPFLHEASDVAVVEICAPGDEEAARAHVDDVVRYLGRHRIAATPLVVPRSIGSETSELLRLAETRAADLLVTGAYGHSRLGEWIFGGMTRRLLQSSPVCCLMSH